MERHATWQKRVDHLSIHLLSWQEGDSFSILPITATRVQQIRLSSRFIRLGNFLALIFVRRDQLPIKQFYGQLPDSEVDMEPVPNFLLDNTRFHHINSVVCEMRSNLYKVNIYITVRFFLKTIIMNSEIVFKKSYCINCCMHAGQKVRQKDINISMFHYWAPLSLCFLFIFGTTKCYKLPLKLFIYKLLWKSHNTMPPRSKFVKVYCNGKEQHPYLNLLISTSLMVIICIKGANLV